MKRCLKSSCPSDPSGKGLFLIVSLVRGIGSQLGLVFGLFLTVNDDRRKIKQGARYFIWVFLEALSG
jgi:hypothetical protein